MPSLPSTVPDIMGVESATKHGGDTVVGYIRAVCANTMLKIIN